MKRKSNINWRPRLLRLAMGVLFAIVAYYATIFSPIPDCSTLRLTVHSGGILALARIVLALFAAILIGIPTPIAAVVAGLLTTPFTGSAITSLALILALVIAFSIGRLLGKQNQMIVRFEHWASGRLWFTDLIATRAQSGLHWASEFIYKTPLPPTLFAAFCGAVISHMQLVELIAGAFLSFIAVIVAYSLAGGTIGCAFLDYTHGFPTTDHILPIIISIIALVIVYKLRSRISL